MLYIQEGTEESFIGLAVKDTINKIGKIIGIVIEGTGVSRSLGGYILVQYDEEFNGHNGQTAYAQNQTKYVGTLKSNKRNCWYCTKKELTLLSKKDIVKQKLLNEVM